jgi:hypothetical protein
MKNFLFTLFITLILFLLSPLQVLADYASLVGRRVEIHGPYCWDTLGVALDSQTCDNLRAALHSQDKKMFITLLNSFGILRITKNTKALVLNVEVLEGRANIVILTGIYRGMSGWIPLEWLLGNEKRPSLKDNIQKKYEVFG